MALSTVRNSLRKYAGEKRWQGKSKLVLGDQYSRVTLESDESFKELRKRFSFLHPSFWFMRGRFGGSGARSRFATQTHFITEKGRFPTGLLEDVTHNLESMNIEVETQDDRKWFHEQMSYEPITSDLFSDVGITLHDYQVDLANLALEQKRGVIKCATGGGKTMIFTAVLKALKEQYPTMMICRNKTVVNQTYEAFRSAGLKHVGRVHMDFTEPDIITCITSQSLHKVPELIPRTRILLVDECHEWASKHSQRHLKLFQNTICRLGFSATPWNEDPVHNFKLKSWIGPELCDVSIDYLRDQKILSSCHAHFYRIKVPSEREIQTNGKNKKLVAKSTSSGLIVPEDAKGTSTARSFFDSDQIGIVENENLQNKIVEIVSGIKEGRILILVRRLPHGDRLKELMPDAHWIRGEDTAETREFVLQQLRQSDQPKVVAIMSAIGFYGLNVLCHHLINACGGKDANLLIQKVGRGLRKGVDKEHLEYHDFLFEGDRFLQRHSKSRIDVLQSEGHQVTVEKL